MYCVVVGLSSAQGIEQILAYLRNTVKGDRDSVDNAPESKRIFFGGEATPFHFFLSNFV